MPPIVPGACFGPASYRDAMTGRPQLTIAISSNGLVVNGEIDASTSSMLDAELAKLDGVLAVVDFSGVSFIDSSGLRSMVDATERAKKAGCSIIFANASHSVRRVVTLSGLVHLLNFDDLDVDDHET